MSTVTTGVRHDRDPALQPATTRRRVQVPWIIVGVLLIAGCALAFGVMAQQLSRRTPVVALARPVERGELITSADLAVAQVAVDPEVPVVPASEAAQLAGRVALAPLPAGALLVPDVLGPADIEIGPDARVVGLSLEPGGYPITTLAPGDTVSVVRTDGTGSVLTDRATVLDSAPAEQTATRLVAVAVDADDAPSIAAAAAQGHVRLVLHGGAR